MELIPILSLIVLVATISTFILAVGAYVLYKIRENKGKRTSVPIPQSIEAELYAPQPRNGQAEIPLGQQRQIGIQEHVYQETEARQGRPAYSQVQNERSYPQMQSTVSARTQDNHNNGNEGPETDERSNKKFMKYTSEGYVPVNKSTKTGENLKWR